MIININTHKTREKEAKQKNRCLSNNTFYWKPIYTERLPSRFTQSIRGAGNVNK